ncbi:MAG TPA: phage tail protein [Streptosporangiaceae bacterium]|jgi:phage tail-like protein|nr:phage tail protein [Streptosporangiaceae bacterium]
MKHPKYPEFMPVASAPIFVISAPNLQIVGGPQVLTLGRLSFQELGGINSEINVEQYVSVDSTGTVNHSKQMGLTKPPTVTLKRGVDTNLALWYWHNMALMGLPTARTNVTLEMYGGGIPSIREAEPLFIYTLLSAWCARINIAGARAGEGFVTEDVTIACDQIVYGDG